MKREDHALIQSAMDGGMSRQQFADLQVRLRSDAEFLALYREYALMYHSLREEFEGRALVTRKTPKLIVKSSPKWPIIVLAAAVAIFAAILLNRNPPITAPNAPIYALGKFSDDAHWTIDGKSVSSPLGLEIHQGALVHLQYGQAQLALATAAMAVIDSPAEFVFVSENEIELRSGSACFRMSKGAKPLTVKTPSVVITDLGTEFGVISLPSLPTEVQVFEGKVQVSLPDVAANSIVHAGQGVRATNAKTFETIPVTMKRMNSQLASFTTLTEEDFSQNSVNGGVITQRSPVHGEGVWRVVHGSPLIKDHHLEGEDFEAFLPIPEKQLMTGNRVLIATMEIVKSRHGSFHSAGWAGMSFYHKNEELLFFGDGYGDDPRWALDVKQQLPLVFSPKNITGPRTVTLRFDQTSGEVSLHEGGLPLSAAFCKSTLPRGTAFDEIRLSASGGGTLSLQGFTLRIGESANLR